MKLKDSKICSRVHVQGHIPDDAEPVYTSCRFGYCTIMRCPVDLMELGAEWGPVACPHKRNENGTLRWWRFPDMDRKHPVARKGRR